MIEKLTRREFLKRAAVVGAGLVLEGCGRGTKPLNVTPVPTIIQDSPIQEPMSTSTSTLTPTFTPPPTSTPTAAPAIEPQLVGSRPSETLSGEKPEDDALYQKKRIPRVGPSKTPTLERGGGLREKFIWRGNPDKPLVALTFDDGWFPESIKLFIETLKETGIKLTVFPSGQAINAFPDLFREIDKLGCEFGCHGTYGHELMGDLSAEEIVKEIDKSQKALNNILGRELPFAFLRPVGGVITEEIARAMTMRNLKGVIWTLSGEGTSKIATPSYVAERIISLAGNGFITLHHFIENDTKALKMITLGLKKRGLSPAKISEVL